MAAVLGAVATTGTGVGSPVAVVTGVLAAATGLGCSDLRLGESASRLADGSAVLAGVATTAVAVAGGWGAGSGAGSGIWGLGCASRLDCGADWTIDVAGSVAVAALLLCQGAQITSAVSTSARAAISHQSRLVLAGFERRKGLNRLALLGVGKVRVRA
ncbi:hypothetical protein ABMA57_13445 [Saccharospirillum sp. HFRX-1]|uniref:hypothetical protein n=1 Tax=unclassified Saccharospirillum TaxID=2633430 RepID=UPI00371C9725